METSHTTAQYDRYDRYNLLYDRRQIQQEMGVIQQHFVNGNLHKRLIQQIQQKCVPECTSLFPTWRQRSKVALNAFSFIEEFQRYECLYNKFSKEYKTKQVRNNFWKALGENHKITAEEAEERAFAQAMGDGYEKAKQVLGEMPCLFQEIWSI